MKPLLEVKNMTVDFQGYPAVKSVSFCVYPDEKLGIIGESGSGKSTVARAVMRLVDTASGRIFLDGRDITFTGGRKRREIYRSMQMVFQSPADSFDPRRTLGDGIGESLRNSGMSRAGTRKRVKELLVQCGLPEVYAGRYPHEVSGGQCQRAAIARALAIGPELLICDEATSSLDVTVQKQIMELLRSLGIRYGMSYLFISHDLALVQNFCDRVIIMHEGKIVEEGITDEVILNPQNDYTKRLVEAVLQTSCFCHDP